jgi:hypothetical protein
MMGAMPGLHVVWTGCLRTRQMWPRRRIAITGAVMRPAARALLERSWGSGQIPTLSVGPSRPWWMPLPTTPPGSHAAGVRQPAARDAGNAGVVPGQLDRLCKLRTGMTGGVDRGGAYTNRPWALPRRNRRRCRNLSLSRQRARAIRGSCCGAAELGSGLIASVVDGHAAVRCASRVGQAVQLAERLVAMLGPV